MAEQTLAEQITAVNAYADYLETLGDRPFPHRDQAVTALRNAATAVIADTDEWTVLDESDPRNVLLQAPDGTQVRLSAHFYGGATSAERLAMEAVMS